MRKNSNKLPFIIEVDKHITLKIRTSEDARELFNLVIANKNHLRAWLPWVDATENIWDTKKFIAAGLEKYKEGSACDFGICYDGIMVGSGGFIKIKNGTKMGEIGYWIAKEWEGKGIITKSVAAMIALGKKKYKLHRIEIKMATNNHRSKAVPERLEFTSEGILRDAGLIRSTFYNVEMWSLLV